MVRRDLIAELTRRTRTMVKVPVTLPSLGAVWVAVVKDDLLRSLMRNYRHDEETGLVAEWNDPQHTYFVRPVTQEI